MTQDIYTRQWQEADWLTYKTIRLEAVSRHGGLFGASFEFEASQPDDFWKARLADPDKGTVFGLYDGSMVIGLTGIYRDWNGRAGVAVLCMSYIREEYRGKGLSNLLYKARIDWAKAKGDINLLVVGHREGNNSSKGANQRWGFRLQKIEDLVYGNGEKAKDYVYELKI